MAAKKRKADVMAGKGSMSARLKLARQWTEYGDLMKARQAKQGKLKTSPPGYKK